MLACSGAVSSSHGITHEKPTGEAGGHWGDPWCVTVQATQERETAHTEELASGGHVFHGFFSQYDFEEMEFSSLEETKFTMLLIKLVA